MRLYQLKPVYKKKNRKRVGRGGKKGTYSGRGLKGQMSRAGKKPRPGFAGGDTFLFKRIPKQRGERGSLKIKKGEKLSRLRRKPKIVNIEEIEKKFKNNEVVSPQRLLDKGLISKIKGRMPKVKILGKGKLSRKVKFEGVILSKSAEKIKSSKTGSK